MSENYQTTTRTPVQAISPEERQRREMQSIADRAYARAMQESKQEIANLQNKHQQETQKLNNQLKNLQGTFSATIKQHEQNLNEMRQQYDQQLNKVILEAEEKRAQDRRELTEQMNGAVDSLRNNVESLRKSTSRAISETNTRIDSLQQETWKELKNQQQQINNIREEFNRKNANAEALKRELLRSCNDQVSIIELKNHEKYAPNELNTKRNRLNSIQNLPNESAIAELNHYFYDLLELSSNIDVRKIEFEALYRTTLDAVNEVLGKVEKNKNELPLTDGSNNVVKDEYGNVVTIDINFWSDGSYQKLETELNEIKERIISNIDTPSYLKENLENELIRVHSIDEKQNALVHESICRANASIIRAEISDTIADYIEGEMNIPLSSCGYENGDQRKAYYIKFEDSDNKILVLIDPLDVENNKVIRKTVFSTLNEIEQNEINRNIDNLLEGQGLMVGHGRCVPDNPQSEDAWSSLYDYDVVHNEIPKTLKRELNIG
ncbi:MAG: hypothetical protein IKA83_00550 [Paludibacteraceae bacterium]|jgi:hypothetical protein|nr:hypothetical protein [Paludibacteraceae bacterium]